MRFTAVIKWSKDRFTIDDDAGETQFGVNKIYGLDGNSLSLRNLDDVELAAIKECSGPTRCEIKIGDDQPITVRHQGWFGRKYSIKTPVDEMSATVGDFSLQSYELISFGTAKATVSRQLIRQGSITIEIADGENEVPLLASVLAIETLRDNRRQAQDSIPYIRLLLRLIN